MNSCGDFFFWDGIGFALSVTFEVITGRLISRKDDNKLSPWSPCLRAQLFSLPHHAAPVGSVSSGPDDDTVTSAPTTFTALSIRHSMISVSRILYTHFVTKIYSS